MVYEDFRKSTTKPSSPASEAEGPELQGQKDPPIKGKADGQQKGKDGSPSKASPDKTI